MLCYVMCEKKKNVDKKIMVISRLFNSLIFMYDILHRILFDETIIVI